MTLTWTSATATSAWLADSPIAEAIDPQTVTDADNKGPLAPNGTTTMPFNCTYQYEYYDLGVYNSLGKQIESTQVANPKF